MIEHGDRVIQRRHRAIIDLLEVGLAGGNLSRVNIEGNDVLGQTQGIQAGVGLIHLRLDVIEGRSHIAELRYRCPINLLDAGVGGI